MLAVHLQSKPGYGLYNNHAELSVKANQGVGYIIIMLNCELKQTKVWVI